MIMPNAEHENKKTKSTPQKRVRLTPKQNQFIYRIFNRSYTVEAAMDELRIWPCLLDQWLKEDRFKQAIDFKLAQFTLQARINAVIFTPRAVRTLGYMYDSKADDETKRKACVDLLKIHNSLGQKNSGSPAASGGAQVARSGSHLAQNGAHLAHIGSRRLAKIPLNPRSQPKNEENNPLLNVIQQTNRFQSDENHV